MFELRQALSDMSLRVCFCFETKGLVVSLQK